MQQRGNKSNTNLLKCGNVFSEGSVSSCRVSSTSQSIISDALVKESGPERYTFKIVATCRLTWAPFSSAPLLSYHLLLRKSLQIEPKKSKLYGKKDD